MWRPRLPDCVLVPTSIVIHDECTFASGGNRVLPWSRPILDVVFGRFNGAPRVWAEIIYFVPKILMKQPHDCSY